jgi:hypothetical protein
VIVIAVRMNAVLLLSQGEADLRARAVQEMRNSGRLQRWTARVYLERIAVVLCVLFKRKVR